MRSSVGRGKTRSSRSRRTACSAPTVSGPTCRRSTDGAGSADSRLVGSIVPERRASRRCICPAERRRANASAAVDDGSNHCTSSTATSSGCASASSSSALRTATPSARGSSESCVSSRRRATSSARRRGGASAGSTSSKALSKRSPRPASAKFRSASAGRLERTRNPRSRARSRPSSQIVDFPIPASPSRTSARGASTGLASRNPRMSSTSSSRPIIPLAMA